MHDKIRWGILGTGNIANIFAADLKQMQDAELIAVGSRDTDNAKSFAEKFSIPNRYASYTDLAKDPNVDVVYVATPHALHKENCLLCLENNKSVLCEKSFTLNANEAKELIDLARKKKLFLMEGMWSRFLPIMQKLYHYIEDGLIGEIQSINADLGFNLPFDPNNRIYNPKLGGGALLDVGIYPISLAFWLMGPPHSIDTMAHLGQTGVDEQACILFGYQGGPIAKLFATIKSETPSEAIILGNKGRIRIHHPMFRPGGITISIIGQKDEYVEIPYEGNGFIHEAEEVMECIRNRKTESSIMPLNETLLIMETMDQIRSKWGLKYPQEN